jgi:hypothetical protein
MKNSFKIGSLIIGIAVSVMACDPPHANTNKTPIDSPQKTIDTGNKATIDTAKKDTTKKM